MRTPETVTHTDTVIPAEELVRGPIVLMYHGTTFGKPSSEYSIEARLFKKHIAYLADNGWQTRLIKDLACPELLTPKTVIITFDDGYADNFEGAFLPLVEHNMKATWFITTDCIGKYAVWMGPKSMETRMLDDQQLREMSHQGMEIGSHTCSHPDLGRLPYAEQLEQVRASKEHLESLLDSSVHSFAYPYGRYNTESLIALKKVGYQFACSVRSGWSLKGSDFLTIRRVTVFSGDTPSILARKLAFADNDVSWRKLFGYYLKRAGSRLRRHPGQAI